MNYKTDMNESSYTENIFQTFFKPQHFDSNHICSLVPSVVKTTTAISAKPTQQWKNTNRKECNSVTALISRLQHKPTPRNFREPKLERGQRGKR